MRLIAALFLALLTLMPTAARAEPACGYVTVFDRYLQNAVGMAQVRTFYRLPPWLPYPVKIWGVTIFNQSQYGMMPEGQKQHIRNVMGVDAGNATIAEARGNYSSFLTLSVDKRGMYARLSKYPATEATLPITTTAIGKYSAAVDVTERLFLPVPTEYARNDRIMIGVEGYETQQIVYPFFNFMIEGLCNAVSPYSEKHVLALRGGEIDGVRLVEDWSFSNHQAEAYDVTIPNDAPYPAAALPMVFNGTSSWIRFRNTRDDWDLPGAFSFSARVATSNVSLSGGQYRQIMMSAPQTTNGVGESIIPLYVGMNGSGQFAVGGAPNEAHLLSPLGYADGIDREIKIVRTEAMELSMYVDGVLVAGPVLDTRHYRGWQPRIGRSLSGGYWDGVIYKVEMTRN